MHHFHQKVISNFEIFYQHPYHHYHFDVHFSMLAGGQTEFIQMNIFLQPDVLSVTNPHLLLIRIIFPIIRRLFSEGWKGRTLLV